MTDSIDTSIFEHKVRVRVCGLLIENHRILLLKHLKIGKKGFLWSPPGGGVDFGENSREALIKEFREETGLEIVVEKFLFVNEYRSDTHHAIELFFLVRRISGEVRLGYDPEMPTDGQLLSAFRWFDWPDLRQLHPDTIHNVFHHAENLEQIIFKNGFFIFEDISVN